MQISIKINELIVDDNNKESIDVLPVLSIVSMNTEGVSLNMEDINDLRESLSKKFNSILKVEYRKLNKKKIVELKKANIQSKRKNKLNSEESKDKVTNDLTKYMNEYYNNKVKSNKIKCELCGSSHTAYSIKQHNKSKKHLINLNINKQQNQ